MVGKRGSSASGVCVGGWRLSGWTGLAKAEDGWGLGLILWMRLGRWAEARTARSILSVAVCRVVIAETLPLPAIFAGRRTKTVILGERSPSVKHQPPQRWFPLHNPAIMTPKPAPSTTPRRSTRPDPLGCWLTRLRAFTLFAGLLATHTSDKG